MRVVSDKYIAGFLDADGSVELSLTKHLRLGFYQKTSNDGVIYLIHKALGVGTITERSGKTRGITTYVTRLIITGQKAVDTLCRLKPYLVTKRIKANRLLCEAGFTERVGTDSLPVHPSRSWLAGYFDGDGCLYAQLNPHGHSASIKVSIDSNTDETDGLELVHKAFGGRIETRGIKNIRWTLGLDASKAKQFLSYISPRLLNKREQAYFVLACADMGNFRDGETISNILKVLKTHPHRLNDLGSEVDISEYVKQVKNIDRNTANLPYNYSHLEVCRECGEKKVYALFLCRNCYQRNLYHLRVKRQSEQIYAIL